MNLNDLSIKDIILFILIILLIYLIFTKCVPNIKSTPKQDVIINIENIENTKIQDNFTTDDIFTTDNISKAINLYYNDDINTLLYLNSITNLILNNSPDNPADNLNIKSVLQSSEVQKMTVYDKVLVKGNINLLPGSQLLFNNIYNFLPKYTVIAYNSPNIPKGWVICDGTNNTPNLIYRFIIGSDDSYKLNSTFGEDMTQLTLKNIRHQHNSVYDYIRSDRDPNFDNRGRSEPFLTPLNTSNSSDWITTDYTNSKNTPHNNMPPYTVLIYIMKQ
jgi:hypothetical protein